VARYKNHPAVIGFQLDNETSAYGTAGPNVQVGFVNDLKKKFKTAQELNRAWGLAYWGQSINDWDEFPSREGTINPGYEREWERYQQKLCTDFLAWQATIVRQVKRSDQFVTHDFAWPALPNVNAWEAAKALDIVAANCYYDVQDEFTGEANAYVEHQAPWKLAKDPEKADLLDEVLTVFDYPQLLLRFPGGWIGP
jgi:beta-galactosidase